MERYQIIKQVGDGTYGTVWKAANRYTNEIVAIKKMKAKFRSWEECLQLREIKCLLRLQHPNIVKLKDVILENGNLLLVFEYMECNLYQVMKDKPKLLTEERIRKWSYQVLGALDYMHQHGIFHRDLKPENLLVSGDVIKIADFGLAREASSVGPYTDYVATRWYRAPEVLMHASTYSFAVDIWAMGAIMAELYNLKPLFPGTSELDEVFKICSVLGTPTYYTWPEGLHLAQNMCFQLPQIQRPSLQSLIPTASLAAVALISTMLSWDPKRRPSLAALRQHAYFYTREERPHVIDIDPPKQGEYVRYSNHPGYVLSQHEMYNKPPPALYNPVHSRPLPYKPPMKELNLFPSTNGGAVQQPQPQPQRPQPHPQPQPAEAFCYGFPDVMRAPAHAQPPPYVARHVPGLGIGSKHISGPNELYVPPMMRQEQKNMASEGPEHVALLL